MGAGLGRTGTTSLKAALEQLLGGPCYHMIEVFGHPEHVPRWQAAAADPRSADWDGLFEGYAATVDWPACSFWPELTDRWPDALVLLSTRADADEWFRSTQNTIFGQFPDSADPAEVPEHLRWMVDVLGSRFTADLHDRDACVAAYEAHNDAVREATAPARLLEWSPGDGWGPLCARLGVPVPEEPFPHLNTSEEWLQNRS